METQVLSVDQKTALEKDISQIQEWLSNSSITKTELMNTVNSIFHNLINFLETYHQKSESEISKLNATNNDLLNRLEQSSNRNILQIQTDFDNKFEKQTIQLSQENSDLKIEILNLKKEISSLQKPIDFETSGKDDVFTELQTHFDNLSKENLELKTQYEIEKEQLKNETAKNATIISENDNLKNQINLIKLEISEVQNQLNECRSQPPGTDDSQIIKEMKKMQMITNNKLMESERENENYKTILTEQSTVLNDLQALVSTLRQSKADLGKMNKQFEDRIFDLYRENGELKKKLETSAKETDSNKRDSNRSNLAIEELNKRVLELMETQRSLYSQIDTLQMQAKESQNKINQLESKLNEANQIIGKTEDGDRFQSLTNKIESLQKENKDLSIQLTQTKEQISKLSELEMLKSVNKNLRQSTTDLRQELTNTKIELSRSLSQIHQLNSHNDNQSSKLIDEQNSVIQSQKAEIDKYIEKVLILKTTNAQMKSLLQENQIPFDHQEEEEDLPSGQIIFRNTNKLLAEIQKQKDDKIALREKLIKIVTMCKSLQQNRQTMTNQVDQLKKEVEEINAMNQQLQNKNTKLLVLAKQLKKSKQALEDELKKTVSAGTSSEKVKELEKLIQRLQKENDELKSVHKIDNNISDIDGPKMNDLRFQNDSLKRQVDLISQNFELEMLDIQTELEQKDNEIKELRKQLNLNQNDNTEMQQLIARNADLESQLGHLANERERAESRRGFYPDSTLNNDEFEQKAQKLSRLISRQFMQISSRIKAIDSKISFIHYKFKLRQPTKDRTIIPKSLYSVMQLLGVQKNGKTSLEQISDDLYHALKKKEDAKNDDDLYEEIADLLDIDPSNKKNVLNESLKKLKQMKQFEIKYNNAQIIIDNIQQLIDNEIDNDEIADTVRLLFVSK